MIIDTVHPTLDHYIGKVVPKRLKPRPFHEVSADLHMFTDVAYRRGDEEVTVEKLTPGEGEGGWLDVWEKGAVHFSHWMFDLWPKLQLARRLGLPADRFLINNNPQAFVAHSIAALGYDPDKAMTMQRGGVEIRARELWRIDATRLDSYTPPWVIEAVRSTFLPGGSGRPRRRIYLSRAKSARRHVVNQAELDVLLQAKGFETLIPEDLTVTEAAAVMAEAEVILSPHGAGLANMVFAPQGCRVVEVFGWHVSQGHWTMAWAMGMPYFCVEARGPDGRAHYELTPEESRDMALKNPADIIVDVKALAELI